MIRKAILIGLAGLVIVAGLAMGVADWQRARDAAVLEQAWQQTTVTPVTTMGSTAALEIVPLVNWRAASDDLKTEPGVSYLVRTDDRTILFDVGFNRAGETPSPLQHNMAQLGIDLAEIDTIFISHNHLDHVGGLEFASERTFSLGTEQVDLSDKAIFTPVPMTYPGAKVEEVSGPRVLSNAVASTGPIPRRLFVGRIDEQALVINLRGRGLVVIVGCGHQTLTKLLQRVEAAFDEPIYGIVGDLHYPVPAGRLEFIGIDGQRRFASGNGIFAPLTKVAVERELATLESKLSFLALGGHDTSDEVLAAAEALMAERFQPAIVGEPIRIAGSRS